MAKEKEVAYETESILCKSIFKNKTLTKGDYTKIWIEMIRELERGKSVKFSPDQ